VTVPSKISCDILTLNSFFFTNYNFFDPDIFNNSSHHWVDKMIKISAQTVLPKENYTSHKMRPSRVTFSVTSKYPSYMVCFFSNKKLKNFLIILTVCISHVSVFVQHHPDHCSIYCWITGSIFNLVWPKAEEWVFI
jgi:hypothetical protein